MPLTSQFIAYRSGQDLQRLPGRHLHLAALVVERAGERVELAAHDRGPLRRDLRLRGRGHLRPVGGDVREAVLDAPVVERRLPGAVHRGLDAAQVVRAPVVDGRSEPRGLRVLPRVVVVADPRDALRLRVLAGCRAVDVLAQHVGAPGADEALRRLLLLGGVVPRVRPDQLHLRLRVDAPARRARTRWRGGSPRGSPNGTM